MPTFTLLIEPPVASGLAVVDRDLDPVAIGIEHERGVIAGTVLGARSRRALVPAAVRHPALEGALHRRDPGGREAHVPGAAARAAVGDVEDRPHDPPGDHSLVLELAPPPERPEDGVVEPPTALQVPRFDGRVMDHVPTVPRAARECALDGLAPARGPAKEADPDREPGEAPAGHDGQMAPLERGADGGGVPGGEESLEEVANREQVGEVKDAVRDLRLRDEDPRQKL